MQIVDADGHVAEGAALTVQCMERWSVKVTFRNDGRPSLEIEGRHHPEDRGPGAGGPPEHGLSVVEGNGAPSRAYSPTPTAIASTRVGSHSRRRGFDSLRLHSFFDRAPIAC
jgi:hypothetical protein